MSMASAQYSNVQLVWLMLRHSWKSAGQYYHTGLGAAVIECDRSDGAIHCSSQLQNRHTLSCSASSPEPQADGRTCRQQRLLPPHTLKGLALAHAASVVPQCTLKP